MMKSGLSRLMERVKRLLCLDKSHGMAERILEQSRGATKVTIVNRIVRSTIVSTFVIVVGGHGSHSFSLAANDDKT
jgi:hypothetical protein